MFHFRRAVYYQQYAHMYIIQSVIEQSAKALARSAPISRSALDLRCSEPAGNDGSVSVSGKRSRWQNVWASFSWFARGVKSSTGQSRNRGDDSTRSVANYIERINEQQHARVRFGHVFVGVTGLSICDAEGIH